MPANWIPCKSTTAGGFVPHNAKHHDFPVAMTVKAHVDAAIKMALTGDPADAEVALTHLSRATNAVRSLRSVRIESSWVSAISRVHEAIVNRYELAA